MLNLYSSTTLRVGPTAHNFYVTDLGSTPRISFLEESRFRQFDGEILPTNSWEPGGREKSFKHYHLDGEIFPKEFGLIPTRGYDVYGSYPAHDYTYEGLKTYRVFFPELGSTAFWAKNRTGRPTAYFIVRPFNGGYWIGIIRAYKGTPGATSRTINWRWYSPKEYTRSTVYQVLPGHPDSYITLEEVEALASPPETISAKIYALPVTWSAELEGSTFGGPYWRESVLRHLPVERTPWENLQADAIRSFSPESVSWGEYLQGIAGFPDLLLSSSVPRTAASAAGTYLQYQYAIAPIDSEAELFDNVGRTLPALFNMSKVQLRSRTVDQGFGFHEERYYTLSCSPRTDPYSVFKTIGAHMGFDSLLDDAWNMVPYSFVVDWFLPVGSAIAEQQSREYMENFHVNWVRLTRILTATRMISGEMSGCVTLREYTRRYRRRLFPCPLFQTVGSASLSYTFGKHWLEGLCLTLQKFGT